MYGGPSHIDTFDYKPKLYRLDGKTIAVKTFGRGGKKNEGRVVGPKWKFKQYGQCGKWVSDLFPHLGQLRRRHRVPPLDDRRLADPRLGHADDEHRQDPQRQPVPRLVGQLRPGQREREPARLRRHARPDRRADQRRQELVERLHAGHVPGRRSSARPATPILDLEPPDGHDRGRCSATCSTRSRDYNDEHHAAPARQHRPRRPHRQLRAGVQDAAARPRGGRPRAGDRRDARRSTASTTSRPTTSAGAACWPGGWSSAACGSSSSTPAAPTTTTTGTPTATWSTNHTYHAGDTDKPIAGAAQGPQAARPARRDARRLGRRVRPPADRRVRQGHRPRPQRLRLHHVDGRRRHQGRRQRRRDRRARRRRRRRPLPRQAPARHVLHQLGLDPERADRTSTAASIRSSSASKGPSRSGRSSREVGHERTAFRHVANVRHGSPTPRSPRR